MSKQKRTVRAQTIIDDALALKNFYAMYSQPRPVRLFAEDYEYLLEREEIVERDDRVLLDGGIEVMKSGSKRQSNTSGRKPAPYAA